MQNIILLICTLTEFNFSSEFTLTKMFTKSFYDFGYKNLVVFLKNWVFIQAIKLDGRWIEVQGEY